jgi:hypothetical protein
MRFLGLLILVIIFASCQKDCPTCEKDDCKDSIPVIKPTCAVDLSKGLVAYYNFNGSSNDVSGNALHATPVNGAKLGTDFLGRPQSAAQFDGIDDYFTVAPNDKLNTDSVTVSCIVLVNSINRRHTLVNKVNFENVSGFAYGVGQSLDSDNKWSWAVGNKTEDCATPAIYDPTNAVYSNKSLEAGRWHNVIATFGKDGQKLFIDGVLVAQVLRPFTTLKKCVGTNLLIGGWWKNGVISLDGKMDDVRIYNRVITQCEIDKLAETFK